MVILYRSCIEYSCTTKVALHTCWEALQVMEELRPLEENVPHQPSLPVARGMSLPLFNPGTL